MTHEFEEDELLELFEYLDSLRAAGRVNMWAAHGFVVRDLAWPNDEANRGTGIWMKTFDKDKTPAERVAIAMKLTA